LLREKCFAGWPEEPETHCELRPIFEAAAGNVQCRAYEFDSQDDVALRLYVVLPADVPAAELELMTLHPLDDAGWSKFLAAMRVEFAKELSEESLPEPSAEEYAEIQQALSTGRGLAYVAPRGIGPTAWDARPEKQIHIQRRFMLLGQTLDGMRVWDVRRAIQALRAIDGLSDVPLVLDAERGMAGIALYAALFEPGIEKLELRELCDSHRQGPNFLNVLRVLDVPQVVAMVAEKSAVRIHEDGEADWKYPLAVAEKLGFARRLEIQEAVVGGK
jgi:hypothetical protein